MKPHSTERIFMSQFFKMIFVAAAMLAANATQAQECAAPPVVTSDAVLARPVEPQTELAYQDILNRCTSFITDLQLAQQRAVYVAQTGNLNGAAEALAKTLREKAQSLPP